MPIVVQKYGGTSVGDTDRISSVADRIVRAREQGQDVVAVVSAMGETTDDLLEKASDITPLPEPRELDMLLTAGERIAMSLLAIAVNARGCKAASYTGSQAGIITDTQHGKARIVEIRPQRIKESLDAGNVVILAGFQGLSTDYDITTLGRGGSDTTAVAMAAALGADVCEIYTDVDGVFTADPGTHPEARKIDQSPTRRCSSSPPPARGSSSSGAWSTLDGTASRSTFGTPSATNRGRGSTERRHQEGDQPACSRAR